MNVMIIKQWEGLGFVGPKAHISIQNWVILGLGGVNQCFKSHYLVSVQIQVLTKLMESSMILSISKCNEGHMFSELHRQVQG